MDDEEMIFPSIDADGPGWLTRQQAADAVGVTPHTVDAWVRAGKLTKHLLRGRWPRFKADDVLAMSVPESASTGVDEAVDDPPNLPASPVRGGGLFSDQRGVL